MRDDVTTSISMMIAAVASNHTHASSLRLPFAVIIKHFNNITMVIRLLGLDAALSFVPPSIGCSFMCRVSSTLVPGYATIAVPLGRGRLLATSRATDANSKIREHKFVALCDTANMTPWALHKMHCAFTNLASRRSMALLGCALRGAAMC